MGQFMARLRSSISMTPRFSDGWRYSPEETAAMVRAAYEYRVSVKGGGTFKSTPEIEDNIRKAAQWLGHGRSLGLVLNGGLGNGKTTLAKALGDTLRILRNIYPEMVAAQDFVHWYQREDERADSAMRSKFLMLDDIGTEAVSVKSYGTEYTPVIELLYKRYDTDKPTIVTTNLTREQFYKTYGPRVADRMKQMYSWLSFNGESFR